MVLTPYHGERGVFGKHAAPGVDGQLQTPRGVVHPVLHGGEGGELFSRGQNKISFYLSFEDHLMLCPTSHGVVHPVLLGEKGGGNDQNKIVISFINLVYHG